MHRQTYQKLKRNHAQFLSVTGFYLDCFEELFSHFKIQWDNYIARYTLAGQERRRPPRIYKNKVFEDTRDMLVFILYYLKNNCLQESLAATFGMNQPQANRWIHLLKEILLNTLKSTNNLPCRDFESFQEILQSGQDVFIDGSERPIPRPSDYEEQKKYYSGKKNSYCEKYFYYISD
jgi:hypothetical protein